MKKKLACALFDTRLGELGVAWSADGISCVQLPEKNRTATLKRLRGRFPDQELPENEPPAQVRRVVARLIDLIERGKADLSKIDLDWQSVPPFHRKVYEAARKIPAGATVTYGQLAAAAGSPAAARAVGQAMARNPFPLIVPCHRVVAGGGKPGGFSAFRGLELKEELLIREGARGAISSRRERKYGATTRGAQPAPPGGSGLCFSPLEAQEHLAQADRKMARLIEQVGPLRLELDEMLTPFETLAESIVYQQLTGKAAATIFKRVKEIWGSQRLPAPERIVDTHDRLLRGAGLSSAKTAALKDLAAKHAQGEIPSLKQLYAMEDEAIIERLTAVRGVGRWTVEMLLIFRLGRPDVWPCTDYGVRKGFARLYRSVEDLPTPKELQAEGEKWRPFRSVAAWYLWRANDL